MDLNRLKGLLLNRRAVCVLSATMLMTSATAVANNRSYEKNYSYSVGYTSTVTELEVVAHGIIRRANNSMTKGEMVTVQEGTDGVREVEYEVSYTDGVETNREPVSYETVVEPVDEIVEYGTADPEAAASSDKPFEYKYVIECTATAYDPSPEENGGWGGMSATGLPLQKGVIAVDPSVIPLGSRVYVEAPDGSWSYGYAVAADTGGAIKGKRVDLLFLTKSECNNFGRRSCLVYVL